jgi:protein involved in polysaccharide export with SLBB domain
MRPDRRGLLAALLILVASIPAAFAQSGMLLMQQAQNQLAQQAIQAPSQAQAQQLPNLTGNDRVRNRMGSETEAEAGPLAVVPLGEADRRLGVSAVFGAQLFTRDATAISDAPNPNYIIAPGDRVSVRVWGAIEAEAVGIVDPNGNLFLPQIGPVPVAGTRAGDLQRVIAAAVQRVYTNQVQVYAVLLQTQRIGVFVTGAVRTPGRYGGTASDSPLDFLVRSGGVEPSRGSYRDIALQRGGRTVANIDLYDFLLSGRLPAIRLQEGDTIVVGRQRAMVGADGAVRNNYFFEAPSGGMTGREMVQYARPLPSATNAVIRGSRGGHPYSRYVTLREFAGVALQDQDTVSFISDAPARTVRVTIEGSRIGPSVLVADRDTQLCQLLNYVEVDPRLANTEGVFLLRPSVAQQQRRAIDEALDRLERQLFMATSATTGVAAIRASEANLVSSYIQRARRVTPEGRVVVTDSAGNCLPMRLQDGDVVVVPERSQTVMVTGEVVAPRAVVWRQDLRLSDYIKQAGGFTPRGSDSALMIRRPSGELVLDASQAPRPGDELVALPRLDTKSFQIASDLFSLIFQVAVATQVFRNW